MMHAAWMSSFIIIFLQGKMDFLLTTVFLEIMKAGGYKRELCDITWGWKEGTVVFCLFVCFNDKV